MGGILEVLVARVVMGIVEGRGGVLVGVEMRSTCTWGLVRRQLCNTPVLQLSSAVVLAVALVVA